jgi:tetratricopeptide (TPR) repeat protein
MILPVIKKHIHAAALAAILSICPAMAVDVPDVGQAIPSPVKAVGPPAMTEFPGGIRMAVSASTDEAQAHVLQGLNHLHAGWEFEAGRHFAAAMREDPDCLLAHWGMLMTLLDPTPESLPARNAAAERLLDLIEQGKGSELERGYAYGLINYINEGAPAAANAFRKVATRFPNDLQAAVFAALFSRGGYDETGVATPDQELAEKELLALIEKHPQSPIPVNALLFIRAEGPEPAASLEMARKLNGMVPDYPPFVHLTGHYEWRCGNHAQAAALFARTVEFYQNWMREQSVTMADCPEWIKAESYRIVALFSKGDINTAAAAAQKLAATPLIDGRPASAGNRLLLWEAVTLPARMLLAQGKSGGSTVPLPKPDSLKKFHDHTLAYWWIDGLRIVLEARRLIDGKNPDEARNVINALSHHSEMMSGVRKNAAAGGELSAWLRSFRALESLMSESRGLLAMAGPAKQQGTAYNWFSSAADRQLPAAMLMPPMLLSPMAARLAGYHLAEKQHDEAIEAYQRALVLFPNDLASLNGLKRAFDAAGKADEATRIAETIESLKSE